MYFFTMRDENEAAMFAVSLSNNEVPSMQGARRRFGQPAPFVVFVDTQHRERASWIHTLFTLPTPENRTVLGAMLWCECHEQGCGGCGPAVERPRCQRPAIGRVYRTDDPNDRGLALCAECGDDAWGTGLFETEDERNIRLFGQEV